MELYPSFSVLGPWFLVILKQVSPWTKCGVSAVESSDRAMWSWWACLEVRISTNWAVTCCLIATHRRPQVKSVTPTFPWSSWQRNKQFSTAPFYSRNKSWKRYRDFPATSLGRRTYRFIDPVLSLSSKAACCHRLFPVKVKHFSPLKGGQLINLLSFRPCRGLLLSLNWNRVLFSFFCSRKNVFLFKKELI